MDEKSNSNLDILLYTLGTIISFSLLFFSKSLSTPIISEINSGTSLVELMFNTEDNLDITTNLFVPLLLQVIGMVILIILLWNLIKNIILKEDNIVIKIIMGILILLLLAILVKSVAIAWTLIVLVFVCTLIVFILLAVMGSFLNTNSQK